MANDRRESVLRHLRRLIVSRAESDLSDEQLHRRFLTAGDQAAFEALVRRHGPMVLSVCRRRLADPQAVEDAFQATFLVLVRKASGIRRAELLGNWLYGVANRIASRAAAQAGRGRRLVPVDDVAAVDLPCPLLSHEARTLVDEEVQRLPEKYRTPVLLCYFQGKTYAEAARLLAVPAGTVATRLLRARERLRSRLVRRGLTLSAAALAGALTQSGASAALPAALVAATASGCAAEAGGTAPAATAGALALTDRVLRDMFLRKVMIAAALALVVALGGAGAGALALAQAPAKPHGGPDLQVAPSQPPRPEVAVAEPPPAAPRPEPKPRPSAEAPAEAKPQPAWREAVSVRLLDGRGTADVVALSPDGKLLATAATPQGLPAADAPDAHLIPVVELWDAETGRRRSALERPDGGGATNFRSLAFSPDGKTLAAAENDVFLWDTATGKLRGVLREDISVWFVTFSPDGKSLAVLRADGVARVWDLATLKERSAFRAHKMSATAAFSADGKTLSTFGHDEPVKQWDVATGRLLAAQRTELRATWNVAFSADGRQVAATSVGGDGIQVCDAATGRVRAACPSQLRRESPTVAAFAPDGKTVAVGSADGTVRLWDLASGAMRATFLEHQAQITSLAFTADGRALASADGEGFVKVWSLRAK
jgi:RNA polymerase sigma factor (sigma-70 family)